MAHLIIPQPDDKFALYSTITDTFLDQDLTKEDIIYSEITNAIYEAISATKRRLDIEFNNLKTKNPSITYEEALANHIENTL